MCLRKTHLNGKLFLLPFMLSPIEHRIGHSLHPCAATTPWKPESSSSHACPRLAWLLLWVLQDHTTSYREPWWNCLWGHLPFNPWLWLLRCTAETRYNNLSNNLYKQIVTSAAECDKVLVGWPFAFQDLTPWQLQGFSWNWWSVWGSPSSTCRAETGAPLSPPTWHRWSHSKTVEQQLHARANPSGGIVSCDSDKGVLWYIVKQCLLVVQWQAAHYWHNKFATNLSFQL